MIPYNRDTRQVLPSSAVKIIGLGGAGANMLERIALDGMEGAELLALNTDVRTLGSCLAKGKIQLGVNLTKGLGTGGDPELGHQAVLEAEEPIRAALKGCRIVFLCVGLGGGTGSGAAPILTRLAREDGAFVVIFATMPFAFEGKRRRDQAETSLNELAVLSNALVTFDNNRMGELVLAKQGIHEAFLAADHMICESIKAVIRLVIRPGLINVGLDDLMSALRTNRSRCLFGSGLAKGKDRAIRALRNALSSPLLDQGALLKDAQTVLVHLCGGEDLTLFEVELLMRHLQKFVPENAHVLFGAAVDPAMADALSITLMSALPEDSLAMAPRDSLSHTQADNSLLESRPEITATVTRKKPAAGPPVIPETTEPENLFATAAATVEPAATTPSLLSEYRRSLAGSSSTAPTLFDQDSPFAEPGLPMIPTAAAVDLTKLEPLPESLSDRMEMPEAPESASGGAVVAEFIAVTREETSEVYLDEDPAPPPIENDEDFNIPGPESTGFTPIPRKRPLGAASWSAAKGTPETGASPATQPQEPEMPKLKLGIKSATPQSELAFESTPRGRFEGADPNVIDGEDLDLPPFLRKKK